MEKATELVSGRRYKFVLKPFYSNISGGNISFYATFVRDNLGITPEDYAAQFAKRTDGNYNTYYPKKKELLMTEIDFIMNNFTPLDTNDFFENSRLKGDWIIAEEFDIYELPMPEFGLFKRA
jgi:hypothetical protein